MPEQLKKDGLPEEPSKPDEKPLAAALPIGKGPPAEGWDEVPDDEYG